jgi:ketosteroid isomerase-like protein
MKKVIPILILLALCSFKKESPNKQTVARYIAGFNAGDHQTILDCLSEEVIWEMPGVYSHSGKAAFDKEIENEGFTGRPSILVSRMVEEKDIVVAEGSVSGKRITGETFKAVFCDVFHFKNGKISKLTSYLMFSK